MNALNCPNCGAPITGDKCEYCGTVFRQKTNEAEKTIEYRQKINDVDNTFELFADNLVMAAASIAITPDDIRKMKLPPINLYNGEV